jgi:magnesium chelatase family protein
LNGELKPVKGVLALVKSAKTLGFMEVFVPESNAEEAALIEDIKIFPVKNLGQVVDHLDEKKEFMIGIQPITEIKYTNKVSSIDFLISGGKNSLNAEWK